MPRKPQTEGTLLYPGVILRGSSILLNPDRNPFAAQNDDKADPFPVGRWTTAKVKRTTKKGRKLVNVLIDE